MQSVSIFSSGRLIITFSRLHLATHRSNSGVAFLNLNIIPHDTRLLVGHLLTDVPGSLGDRTAFPTLTPEKLPWAQPTQFAEISLLSATCMFCLDFMTAYGYWLLAPHSETQHFYLLPLGGVRPKPSEGQKGSFTLKDCLLALSHAQVILNGFFFVPIIVKYRMSFSQGHNVFF